MEEIKKELINEISKEIKGIANDLIKDLLYEVNKIKKEINNTSKRIKPLLEISDELTIIKKDTSKTSSSLLKLEKQINSDTKIVNEEITSIKDSLDNIQSDVDIIKTCTTENLKFMKKFNK